jgi:dienelactone hydrolase
MAAMWGRIARDAGLVVLAPSEAGANDGYHFSERERLAALAALRWVRRRVNVDENKVFATGVSRGGHLAWDLALRHPELFAGIAPMIGGPRITISQGQNNLRYVENVARLPIRDLQGAKDDPALVASVQLAFEKLRSFGASDAQLFLHPDLGHSFDMKAVDWKAFFASVRRGPRPERVVRAAAKEDEGRAFWLEVTAFSPSVDETFVPEVSELKWAGMSEDERRRYLVAQCEQRTARLEVQRYGVGRFSGRSTGVKRFRLLLTSDDFDSKQDLELTWNGDVTKKRLRASSTVLLAEFAERFDRTFLPVAELEVH